MSKLLIKNAKSVDNKIQDILIENQIIQKISPSIEIEKDMTVIKLDSDCYISAGWIDAHTHCFEKFEIYADNCDEIGYKQGVTCVIDAGTAGADNVLEFYDSIKNCKTHVYSLLNISKTGIYAQNELADLANIDINALEESCKLFPNFIVGIKARVSKSVVEDSGNQPLYKAMEIANKVKLPLMVHIGTEPSKIDVIMKTVRNGDIITHIFNPKSNGILKNGEVRSSVLEAYQRGVYFDLGHGTDSFSFDVLEKANDSGIKVHTISSDIYHRNRKNGPVYNLATTMTKLYNYGYTLPEIINCVTKNPAEMLKLKCVGKLEEGYSGDLTIFKIIKDNKILVDSTGKEITVNQYIQPIGVLIRNEYIKLEEN